MKVTYKIPFVFFLLPLISCEGVKDSKTASHPVISANQQAHTFERTTPKHLNCQYLLFLPEGYGRRWRKWPLILFLHGMAERGSNLKKVKRYGPPKIVEKQKDFPFILVSPQCPKGDWWTEKTELLINLLDDIVSRYDVDTDRIYLTGLSMGGDGTWALAATYPERFAAIAPVCGRGEYYMAHRFKGIPVWAFHGARDILVPLKKSKEMVNAIKDVGGNAKLTVYPGVGHNCWKRTYNNKELYDWFLKHRKSEQTN